MAQGFIPYPGYPAPAAYSVKNFADGDLVLSNNYQQGGYNLNATSFGMLRIEAAGVSARSESGNYIPIVFYPAISANNETQAVPPSYVTLKVYYAANSVEVANNTDLSAEIIKLSVRGI